MFTGLIESVGEVAEVSRADRGTRLRILTPIAAELTPGESVSVNGVCLTATACGAEGMGADIGPETARVTTLGDLHVGSRVNLERSMRADGRFGGHFVQGHVDGTGVVEEVREEGDSHWLVCAIPASLEPFLIQKGSIAVDGVSLTIARLGEGRFEVMIIPFTWSHTTLSSLQRGDHVNIECDMVGKYVARSVALAARGEFTT
jgi:riboflavin synthase